MRLSRLDLTRYGKFTDTCLDFGSHNGSGPDLHIIYGPNEAGKSTSLAAFMDLLFGIETQSAYNFLHPYSSMQIGAALEVGGVTRELVRVKARQNSLLGPDGSGVDEGILAGALSGISRASYRTMFSLDDESLEAGGETILASKGELGQLLFQASAGISGLSQTLTALHDKADVFHKPRARTTELGELKKQLAELKEQKDSIDILASAFANLVTERDAAGVAYDLAMKERAEAKARMDGVQRLLDALPAMASAQSLRQQMEASADLAEPPVEWAAELSGMMQDDTRLLTQLAGIDEAIERLEGEIDGLDSDEPALALAARIKALTELRARYITAEKDLPDRNLTLRGLDAEIAGILQRLGQPAHGEPKSLVLSAAIVGALRELIESRSGIQTELQASKRELVRAEEAFEDAEAKLYAIKANVIADNAAGLAALSAVIAQLRGDDHGVRRRLAAAERSEQAQVLEERMAVLAPFAGDADALAALVVPEAAQIGLWKAQLAEVEKRIDRHAQELERLVTAHALGEAELVALRAASGAIDDDEAAAVRQMRDAAWARHLAKLDATTADAFTKALQGDDTLGAARLAQSTDVAKLRQSVQGLASSDAALKRTQALAEAAAAELEAVGAALREAVGPLFAAQANVSPASVLVTLEAWLKRRSDALETRSALRKADKDFDNARRDGEAAASWLAKAMAAAGIEFDAGLEFDALLAFAANSVDLETRRQAAGKAARERFEACEADGKRRRRDLKLAEEAESAWAAQWATLLARCWLGQLVPMPELGAVRGLLEEVARLAPVLEERGQLADRITKMVRDEADFIAELSALVEALGESFDPKRVIGHADGLAERIERAKSQSDARARKLSDQLDAGRRRQEIADAIAVHDARKAEFLAFFGVDNLNEVSERFEMVRMRNQLRARVGEMERDLIAALRVGSLAEAESALSGVDAEALGREVAELDARFADLDQRTRQLYAAQSKAADAVEAVGGDDAVAKIAERRQTVLLELEDKALEHLRLRIGALAVEQALRVYRDKHRSSMMERASEAFCTISRGAYTGLAARPEKDTEVLIGLTAGGGSKLASEMSKGTRFQLYLALRVAGYYEFAQTRQPVPFFADDIMETFDDFRAEEAFRLFAEMAEVGQVIYLTHHRHLCDIARAVCPNVKVHELGAVSVG